MLSGDVEIRRRTGLVTLIALLAAVGWFTAAHSAAAGGPTSVLLANPQTGRVAALYHTDKAYERLAGAVGASESQTGSTNKPGAVTDDFTGEIRLTWLIHDMSIWRIDRVHATEDGMWVQTVVRTDGGDVFDQPGTWHRPVDPKALAAALQDARLLTTAAAEDDSSSIGSKAESDDAAAPLASTSTAESTSGGLIAAVAVVGLLVGGAGATLLQRSRAGRKEHSGLSGDTG